MWKSTLVTCRVIMHVCLVRSLIGQIVSPNYNFFYILSFIHQEKKMWPDQRGRAHIIPQVKL